MFRTILNVACAATIAAMLGISSAGAATYDNLFVFGDSTVDSGWWSGALAGQCDGVATPCTTGNTAKDGLISSAIAAGPAAHAANGAPVGAGYPMNTQILATDFGISNFKPANQGGTNYAISGSLSAPVSGAGNLEPNTNLPSTMTQIAHYLSGNPIDQSGLYLISSGGNDVSYATQHFSLPADQKTFLMGQASALASEIAALQTAGAKSIVVYGLQSSMGLAPFMTNALFTDLTNDKVNFLGIDIAGLIAAVQANPSNYDPNLLTTSLGVLGMTTLSACVTQIGATSATGWGQWCANTNTPSSSYAYLNPNLTNPEQQALFSDNQHLSAAGQQIEAKFVFDEITTPVPAALPLFATGLAGLGLLSWRRKRKAQAIT